MAGLTGLLGTFLISHLFNNPHNQSCTNNKNKNINIPKAEGYSLKDASIAHDILESRRGGGSLFLKP